MKDSIRRVMDGEKPPEKIEVPQEQKESRRVEKEVKFTICAPPEEMQKEEGKKDDGMWLNKELDKQISRKKKKKKRSPFYGGARTMAEPEEVEIKAPEEEKKEEGYHSDEEGQPKLPQLDEKRKWLGGHLKQTNERIHNIKKRRSTFQVAASLEDEKEASDSGEEQT